MTNQEAIKYLIAPTATSTKPSTEYLKQKEAYDLAIMALEERPQGEWITKGYEPFGRCNICGGICEINNFCGHCGVKMKNDT